MHLQQQNEAPRQNKRVILDKVECSLVLRKPQLGRPLSHNHPIHTKGKPTMARTVTCVKLGKEAEGLDFAPYPGELGKRIWEGVSKEAWAAWLKHQTMLVNENRLNLADARARQYLARQMEAHFFGDGADAAQGYVPPSA